MTRAFEQREEFVRTIKSHPEVVLLEFTRDGYRTVFVEGPLETAFEDLLEEAGRAGYLMVVEGSQRVRFEASPEGDAGEVRVGGNRLSCLPPDRSGSSGGEAKKSSEGQQNSETGEWSPTTASLREGEQPDVDAHTRRNLETIRQAHESLSTIEECSEEGEEEDDA